MGVLRRSLPILLAASVLLACPWGYGESVDQSRFVSAVLSDDGRTVVFSYHRLRYRPATGLRAFPDGGVPRYLEDETLLGVLDLETQESRILRREENQWWTPGQGAFHVQQVTGKTALVGQGGQTRGDLEHEHYSYLLDTESGALEELDVESALAVRGRARGTTHLVRDDGLLVMINPSLAEREAHLHWQRVASIVPEIWLREPGGALRRVAASDHYEGFRGDSVYYWTPGDRLHRRYDVASGKTQVVPDPRLPRRDVVLGVGLSTDRRGLELQRKLDGSWQREPLRVDGLP